MRVFQRRSMMASELSVDIRLISSLNISAAVLASASPFRAPMQYQKLAPSMGRNCKAVLLH